MAQDVNARSEATPTAAATYAALSPLACPRCRGPLAPGNDSLQCGPCEASYPVLAGVPWLFADPQAERTEWRNRWHHAIRHLQSDAAQANAARAATSSPHARRRLNALIAGYEGQQRAVTKLLAALELGMAGSESCYQALGTALPEQQRLFSYEANLFRDWCWGNVENRAAANAVLAVLEDALVDLSGKTVLVLGSGGGRLAWDLHSALVPRQTLALDLNPYLAIAAQQVCHERDLTLWEFPLAPRSAADVAVERTLRCADRASASGLQFILGDALAPPIAPASVDLVITPWFADVCGAAPDALAALINSLLTANGHWLNHGSVAFRNPDPAQQLVREELLETVTATGFRLRAQSENTMPYLCSPSSRHGRTELVHTFCVQKTRPIEAPGEHPLREPLWLDDHQQPVPRLRAFAEQANATAIHAFLMSLIDGERSIEAMAQIMAERQMLPAADARQALEGFLRKMHCEATGDAGL